MIGDLKRGCPWDDLEPLNALMAKRRRAQVTSQLVSCRRAVLIPLFSEQGDKPLVKEFGLTPKTTGGR